MPRPVKWSRDLHPIRDRAVRSKTETWSWQDIEHLFAVGRATAQTLMRAIGEVQSVGAGHFVGRTSLLTFLDEMILASLPSEHVAHKRTAFGLSSGWGLNLLAQAARAGFRAIACRLNTK